MHDMDAEDRKELAELRADVRHLINKVEELTGRLSSYTPRETWEALRDRVALLEKMCFGAAGVIVLAVVGAVIALVIKK